LLQLLIGANDVQIPSPDETLFILPALVITAFWVALGDALCGPDHTAATA
jgi:hypothetical protein